MILAGTLVQRTNDSDSSQREKLTAQSGSAQTQSAQQIRATVAASAYNKDTKRVERGYEDVAAPVRGRRIGVNLDLEQRRDGLLWYNLYTVRFRGHYVIRNDTKS